VFGAGTPRSRSEERRRAEGVLDPLAKIIGVTLGGQAEPHVPPESKCPCQPCGNLFPRLS
jgi:hypothetical protein